MIGNAAAMATVQAMSADRVIESSAHVQPDAVAWPVFDRSVGHFLLFGNTCDLLPK